MNDIGPVFRHDPGAPYDPSAERGLHRLTTVRSTSLILSRVDEQEELYLGRLAHFYTGTPGLIPRLLRVETVKFYAAAGERSGDLSTSLKAVRILVIQAGNGRLVYGVTLDCHVENEKLVGLMEDGYYESIRLLTSPTDDAAESQESDHLVEAGDEAPACEVWNSIPELVGQVLVDYRPGDEWFVEPDIHQLLCLSPTLSGLGTGPETVDLPEEFLLSLVYRVYDPMREGYTSISFPKEMNRGWDAVACVGGFVSVLCGHQDYIENCALLSAASVVAATSEIRRARQRVIENFDLLKGSFDERFRGEYRLLLGEVNERLAEIELELSENIESVVDLGLWIPSLRVDDYHQSLIDASRLFERTQTISRRVERFTSIAAARAQRLASVDFEVEDHRRRSWALVAALISVIAIPITIVLAFFGANAAEIDPSLSIFDWERYLWIYLGTGGVLAIAGGVVVAFWVLAHPSRRRSPRPSRNSQDARG